MRLMQVKDDKGRRRIIATDRGKSWFVKRHATVYDLSRAAIKARTGVARLVRPIGLVSRAPPRGGSGTPKVRVLEFPVSSYSAVGGHPGQKIGGQQC